MAHRIALATPGTLKLCPGIGQVAGPTSQEALNQGQCTEAGGEADAWAALSAGLQASRAVPSHTGSMRISAARFPGP